MQTETITGPNGVRPAPNMYQGQLTHVLDRGFIVTPGRRGYAIGLYGPDTGWSAVRASVWEGLLQTFMPGG